MSACAGPRVQAEASTNPTSRRTVRRLGALPDLDLRGRPVDSAPGPCDDAHVSRSLGLKVFLGMAGAVFAALAYRAQVDNLPEPFTTPGRALATVVYPSAFLVAGLIAWSRRPGNRIGPLMILAAFLLFARQFRYSHDPAVFTLFFLIGELGYVVIGQVALAYPSGSVTDRLERLWLKAAYVIAVAFPLVILLFYDGSKRLDYFDPSPRESLFLVSGDGELTADLQKAYAVTAYGCLVTLFILLIVRKLIRATPRARRILAPLLLDGGGGGAPRPHRQLPHLLVAAAPAITYDLFWWQVVAVTAFPIALLAGLLRARLARVHVGELVVHLEQTPVDGIRDELARALDDPTLELGLWLPGGGRSTSTRPGRRWRCPTTGPTRAVTWIEHEGEPLAVLDPRSVAPPRSRSSSRRSRPPRASRS